MSEQEELSRNVYCDCFIFPAVCARNQSIPGSAKWLRDSSDAFLAPCGLELNVDHAAGSFITPSNGGMMILCCPTTTPSIVRELVLSNRSVLFILVGRFILVAFKRVFFWLNNFLRPVIVGVLNLLT